jgi:hypothetical protein
MEPDPLYRVRALLAGVRDFLIIVVLVLSIGFGAYAYGQLDGLAETLTVPAADVPCDDSYPDALPC